ncbi:BON domain-containing protein [Hymenobacter daeguensis]
MQTLNFPLRNPAQVAADADITAAIERCFLTRKGVAAHLIDVGTRAGMVTLTGAADSLLARRRAEDIALAVRGVCGVVNELVVLGPEVEAAELCWNVQQALADDPATHDYALRCTVADGRVCLAGRVRSWAEKQLVCRVVEGVRGVRRIDDAALRICRPGPAKTDADLTAQLQDLLHWDMRVGKTLVQVRFSDGVAHLGGTVGSLAVKRHVESLAFELGAVRVDGRNLCVARGALEPGLGREEAPAHSDEAIAQAVHDAFRHDPRLQQMEPLVQVHAGVVTLVGIVDSLRARACAEHDARHVAGVGEVHNLLKVRTDQFWPDEALGPRVVAALQRDPYLSGYHFSVSVLNGRATVHGRVSSLFEREQAYDVASGVSGVVEVESRVAVPPDGHLAAPAPAGGLAGSLATATAADQDAELAERIRTRYCWSASLHGQGIELEVHSLRVTLTGTVDTWLERRLAAREASELGARDVNNHLRVGRTRHPEATPPA